MMTQKEKQILQFLQDDFPLVERPFLHAAGAFGMKEDELLRLLAGLKRRGVIRYLGIIFDPARLNITSVLSAAAVPAARAESVARVISGFREVSHNYLRSGCPNLWFTLSASSLSALQSLIGRVEKKAGVGLMVFPAKRTFKIDARFDLARKASRKQCLRTKRCVGAAVVDRKLAIELNKPLSLCRRPFAIPAVRCKLSEPRLRAIVAAYMRTGLIRRFGLVLSHGDAGFNVNCMVVWQVPRGRVSAAAGVFKGCVQITHCYERLTAANWPYNVYTMIHCRSRSECEQLIARLVRQTGVSRYRALYTEKEFKKTKTDLAAIL
jgi:siroheme decarboxylase